MLAIKTNVITNEVIKNIKEHQKLEFESFSNWIPAGTGNFEKTRVDGRYRNNCNTYRDTITCEDHRIKSLKLIFNHCNKLDCESCFIHALKDKLISNTSVNLECVSKKRCFFLKDNKCKLGVPCNKCRMEYLRKKEQAKNLNLNKLVS